MSYKPNIKNYLIVKCQDIQKLFVTLSGLQRHATIRIDRPKWLNKKLADEFSEKILEKEVRKSNLAALTYTQANAGVIISHIKNIHPPAHVLVVVEKHHKDIFDTLDKMYPDLPIIEEYKMPRL